MTTIVLNDKLKEWINNKSETLDLITMAHWDIDDHLKFQKIMRDRFINDSYEGMLENGNKLSKSHSDFPNIYALFLLLISEVDQHDNWASVIDCDIKRQVDLIDYADIMSLNNETKYIGLIMDERDDSYTIGYHETTEIEKLREWKEEMLECSNVVDCRIIKIEDYE